MGERCGVCGGEWLGEGGGYIECERERDIDTGKS